MLTYKFKNGSSFTGTVEQLSQIALMFDEILNLEGYYISESKGMMKISDMDAMHIRNAILKQFKRHIDDLSKTKDISNEEFMKRLVSISDNKVIQDLVKGLMEK